MKFIAIAYEGMVMGKKGPVLWAGHTEISNLHDFEQEFARLRFIFALMGRKILNTTVYSPEEKQKKHRRDKDE